jgi:fructose-bisphosphate aldolase class II
MAYAKTLDILRKCADGKFAVGAFNINGLDQIEALIQRANTLRSPILITVPGVIEPYVDFEQAGAVTYHAASKVNVPVGLHLSHGMDFGSVERALKAGFTSVMFDGSKLDYEENIKQTKEAVAMGRAYGAAVEGELGALPGAAEGGAAVAAGNDTMTDPALAKEYIRCTGVDILAVSIGNAHGLYKGKPSLDFQRLEQIYYGTMSENVYLTLHGGTGIPEDHVNRAVREGGIVKICIYTDMCMEGKKNAVAYTGQYPEYQGNFDIPEMIKAINTGFADAAQVCMQMFMSVNRAQGSDRIENASYRPQKAAPGPGGSVQPDKVQEVVVNQDVGPEYPSKLGAREESKEVKAGIYWHTNV